METKRQIIHIAMSAFALLLAVLSRPAALACAVAAFLFNMFVMPRIGKGTFREHEKGRGYSTGMLMYPISVFVLILIFPAHIAAGAWAIMAFGDGFASLIGAKFGKKKLPWNPNKSWAGFIGFIITAAPAAWVFMCFVLRHSAFGIEQETKFPMVLPALFFTCVLPATLFAAVAESLNIKIDDNISVPFIAGIFLWLFIFIAGIVASEKIQMLHLNLVLTALLINAIIAFLSYKIKSIDLPGSIGGFIIGSVIYCSADYKGFLILLLFFIMGTASTKIGYKVKESRGLAQERHGRRGLRHALANGAAGMIFAIIFRVWIIDIPYNKSHVWETWGVSLALYSFVFPWVTAFIAAFAAATADTISSELGQLWGRRPILITTFKPVPAGVNGGVTLTGTLLGLIAAAGVAAAACALHLMPWKYIWLPIAAAQFGSLIDSILGATLENNGLIDNECVNFLCTLSAGLFAVFVAWGLVDLPFLKMFFEWR